MRIGLPKGRLHERSSQATSVLRIPDADFYFLRLQDIPALLAEGLLDAGISSDEWIQESQAIVHRIAPLCWYHARISSVVHPESPPVACARIVSEYRTLATSYAERTWSDWTVRSVYGACESYLPHLADVAVECVESGASLRRHGLIEEQTLLDCDVWLLTSPLSAVSGRHTDELVRWSEAIRAEDQGRCPSRERKTFNA